MDTLVTGAFAAACSATAALTQALVVPRIPEPEGSDGSAGWAKPRYASLATRRDVLTAALAGLVCGGAAALRAPAAAWPLALVVAGPTASLVHVDARTTYLPLRLTRICQLLAAAACTIALAGAAGPATTLLRVLVAVSATALFFWLLWRISGALGFGDVRLAPLLAVLPATSSWSSWGDFLLLGTATAATWGLVTQLHRRRHPSPLGTVFPYGPGLFIGCWLAVVLS